MDLRHHLRESMGQMNVFLRLLTVQGKLSSAEASWAVLVDRLHRRMLLLQLSSSPASWAQVPSSAHR